jgi:hypothetical protein
MKRQILLKLIFASVCTLFSFSGLQAFASENDFAAASDNTGNIVICQNDENENPFLKLMMDATKNVGKMNACNNACTKKRHECENSCAQSSPSRERANICFNDCRNEAFDCSSACNQQ